MGQSVSQGQTIGTAGRTGWTYCQPHLHFQRQARGGWITNSQAVYFDEYPGQQLQRGQWYQSQNYWPGDCCPTQVGSGWGCSGIIGIATGREWLRRRKGCRLLARVLSLGLIAVLVSGCGQRLTRPEGALPAAPAVPLGPDQPAAMEIPSPTPTVAEPPLPPTPGPVPTPRPVTLPPAKEVEQMTAGWKVFEDATLGVRFRYPPDYEIRVQPITSRKVGISIDRPWGEGCEIFGGVLVFLLEKEDSRLLTSEGLEAWVRELPEGESPIPGEGPIRVVEKIQVGGRPAFVIQEPLWPGDPPNVQSLIVIGKERVFWIPLGDTMGLSPERTEKIWPLQMAFLATLEVTR
ncbi:MAG: M23 family metallopeptidase [Thermoflexales bacterium]|nr:M23 family metallopeptidase [Thermoflexales bacterium]